MKNRIKEWFKWDYSDIQNDIYYTTKVQANKLSATMMLIFAFFILIVFLFNTLGVFNFNQIKLLRVAIESIIVLVIPAIICFIFKGRKHWIKYMLMSSWVITVFSLYTILSTNFGWLLVLPLLLALRYYSRSTTSMTYGLTAILLILMEFYMAFFGEPNLSILGTNYVVESISYGDITGHFVEGYTSFNYLHDLFRFDFAPKFLILIFFTFIAFAILFKGRAMVNDQSQIADKNARISQDLKLATNIQLNLLPQEFPVFPNIKELDVYASMHAAKNVGGDFYDLFEVDDDHVALVIADVSGKGVPASLFMVVTKTLIKDQLLAGKNPGEAFTNANHLLCDNNKMGMFVTAWLGLLEVSTGKVLAVNAGHNPPMILKQGKSFEPLIIKKGLVLAGMDGIKYTQTEFTLGKGDKLFLYTDGITEATNENEELYGENRLLEFLNNHKEDSPLRTLLKLEKDVRDFYEPAEQFDDMTMVMLDYRGKENKLEKKFPAKHNELENVQKFVEDALVSQKANQKDINNILIVVEEIFINIANYAYGEESGDAIISLLFTKDRMFTLNFIDTGTKFNPLERKDPNIHESVEERDIGGLGIYMTKKFADELKYEYVGNMNILTFKKKI